MNHSFSVEIAERYGIEKAVILENFYFWIRKNKANKKNIHDGRCYTYNTAEAFAELFPYIRERRIAQLLREMENEDNLLLSGQFFSYDRTKSYTLTDFALSFFEHSNIQNFDNGKSKKCIIENQENGLSLNTDINTVINPNIKADELPAPSYIPKTEYKNCNEALKEIHKLILSHNEKQTENKKKISICKDFFYFSQNEARSFTELFKRAKPVEVIEALKNYLLVASADVYISSFSINAFCKSFNNYLPEYFDMSKYVDLPKGGLDEIAENTVNEMIEAGYVFRIPVFYKHKEEWFNMGMPKGEKLVEIVKNWTEKEDNQ
jgi:hypothetical protein